MYFLDPYPLYVHNHLVLLNKLYNVFSYLSNIQKTALIPGVYDAYIFFYLTTFFNN